MAIKITAKEAKGHYDLGASKFFGTPTIPQEWCQDFSDDEIFFLQIRLSDIADLDTDNNLPHTGYLYVFLHTDNGNYNLRADVRYYDGEPSVALDDFNCAVDGYEAFNKAWLMELESADDTYDGTRLFGSVSGWSYEETEQELFMQFDPLDSKMGFLDFLDGYLYFLFDENKKDLSKITLKEEYS